MKRKYLILLSLSGFILALDQLTKNLVYLNLEPGTVRSYLGGLVTLERTFNAGFAFGLVQRTPDSLRDVVFLGLPVFALVLIVLVFIKLQDDQMLTSIALTTLLAGAMGNLIDRAQYGHVVDFLNLHFGAVSLPAFNVADVSIALGVVLMVVGMVRGGWRGVHGKA
ncbi:signal peptidase II [bacterium]|nr:signal peptidase II [bacterium]